MFLRLSLFFLKLLFTENVHCFFNEQGLRPSVVGGSRRSATGSILHLLKWGFPQMISCAVTLCTKVTEENWNRAIDPEGSRFSQHLYINSDPAQTSLARRILSSYILFWASNGADTDLIPVPLQSTQEEQRWPPAEFSCISIDLFLWNH